jgi:uroporphyrinogen III methyltransferase/synthase
VLPEELAAAGAQLEQVVVYRYLDAEALPGAVRDRMLAGRLDWIGLSSPSIARTVAGWLDARLRATVGTGTRLASISPVTTAAARECGLPIAAEATEHTWEGIFAAISRGESASNA